MSDIWSVVRWWDDWQLRILVLGSLGLQWFLLLAAPMRKYTIPRVIRTCIWLAYISSDALAIYALATLFNRHARGSNCGGVELSRALEVLWAPVLLIHLGGQQEMTGYEIEDNELWTRHTVTLVSQVAVALYAFCKSWRSSSDWKLLAAAVLLFVVGVLSFSEKPLALNRAKIKRLAAVSAWVQGTKKPSKWRKRVNQFFLFEESNCFTGMPTQSSGGGGEEGAGGKEQKPPVVALTEADKVLMVLSDMSLLAAAKDLVSRNKAGKVEDVLPPLPVAEKALPRWLRSAFAFIYTRATVVVTPLYLLYHLLVVPVLHMAALALFTASDKHPYRRADVKITYIVLCLTAALDVLAVFIRQLLYRFMSMTKVPALCETVPGYNLVDAALWEGDKSIGWIYKCARRMGFNCNGGCLSCRPQLGQLYKKVAQTVIADLVDAQDRDLASYRILDSNNWALSEELQGHCGEEIKESLRVSFDRSVLLWHMASDLCFRYIGDAALVDDGGRQEGEGGGGAEEKVQGVEAAAAAELGAEAAEGGGGGGAEEKVEGSGEEEEAEEYEEEEEEQKRRDPALRLHIKCTVAISNYMAHLLNFNPEMLLTGSRHHLISEAVEELKSSSLSKTKDELGQKDVNELIAGILDRAAAADGHGQGDTSQEVFHILEACKLAKELLEIRDPTARWMLMYRVWLGMLCYSASMCRGYLHAKSLGEGGEFLSFVWLVLSLKGAKSLADKLQMPPEASDTAKSNAPPPVT
ncbi:hypothetical protein CFC21_099403 [Triticum aestivum]|uniref:DUF4220 domain-containing protein n=1 Tax=Triticum aestivum TaxID=4565 RepID=A0A077S154_WHEAT|nr:hypothetical protein CFC21_099403 [Triticum aestivum]CDM86567.1 unnamed protein product [Triticum aestivum]